LDVFTVCPAKQRRAVINKTANGAPLDMEQRPHQCIFTVIMSCDFIHVHKKSMAFRGPIFKKLIDHQDVCCAYLLYW